MTRHISLFSRASHVVLVVVFDIVYIVVMNALFVASCDFLELQSRGSKQGSIGFLKFNNPLDVDSEECVDIVDIADREIEDKAFMCARICSMMAFGFGFILVVFGFSKQWFFPLPCTGLIMDLSATGVQISLALVYVIWMSDICDAYTCVYGQGAWYLLATQILWMIVGCFSRCMREGRSERNQKD